MCPVKIVLVYLLPTTASPCSLFITFLFSHITVVAAARPLKLATGVHTLYGFGDKNLGV